METFIQAVDDFKNVHHSVQKLLSKEERGEDHVDWYEPRITNFKYFEKEVKVWKGEQMAQSRINPLDSISNVSRQSKGSRAQSSVSSACKKAAAENAALLTRAAALKEKQALQLQEAELKARLERMELDTEIAASAAKIKVLQMDMDEETQQDAMNDYFEASKLKTIDFMDPEVSPVEFMRMGALPKTPLQHTVETFGFRQNVQSQRSPQAPMKQSKPSRIRITDELSHSHETHDNLSTVIKGQGNLAELIITQQKLALLPAREITAFDGDPLNYHVFMRAFEHVIEDKTSSSQDTLLSGTVHIRPAKEPCAQLSPHGRA